MEWDTEALLRKINNISEELKEPVKEPVKEKVYHPFIRWCIDKIGENVYNELTDTQRFTEIKYIYKDYISFYSQSYIEINPDWYWGPDLTIETYHRLTNNTDSHYLESKESIIELYKLFIYFGLLENVFNKMDLSS